MLYDGFHTPCWLDCIGSKRLSLSVSAGDERSQECSGKRDRVGVGTKELAVLEEKRETCT